jgi:hypothetical protein
MSADFLDATELAGGKPCSHDGPGRSAKETSVTQNFDPKLEDQKITWRENAIGAAKEEAKARGLQGQPAEQFIKERASELYADYERIARENKGT